MAELKRQAWVAKELTDVIWIREAALVFVEGIGMRRREAWGVTIAVSELATNAVKFAGRGELTLNEVEEDGRRAIELVVEDRGPGIDDPEIALVDGYSMVCAITGRRGLGNGLGAVRRLMSSLRFERRDGGGTRIVARRWIR